MGKIMNLSKKTSVGFLVILSLTIWLGIMTDTIQADTMPGTVLGYQKISQTEGNFTGTLEDYDYWGCSVTNIGDLDNDGVIDLVVGGWNPDAPDVIWVLFMNADGTVREHQKISETEGGFTGDLENDDHFGYRTACIGDLDGDGVVDLAVGAHGDDDGGTNTGAVWILFLNTDGTVKAHQKISDYYGSFSGKLDNEDNFGMSIAALGDLNGDNVLDIAVSATKDDDGDYNSGAVWILFLNPDGTVRNYQKISNTSGNFQGHFNAWDFTGWGICTLGDLDGDNISELVLGAPILDTEDTDCGGAWILFLNPDGTVKNQQLITENIGGFTGELDRADHFGRFVCDLGDINGDSIPDLAVTARYDDDGGTNRGAVWILFLNTDGTVSGYQKISSTEGNFTAPLDDVDWLGDGITCLGDFNGDHKMDIAVSAIGDDDGGTDHGAIWIMFLDGVYDPYQAAVYNIQSARDAKMALLDEIDAAIEKELAAIDDLNKLIRKPKREGDPQKDLVQARNRVRTAIVQQKNSQFALQKSIRELDRALELLGILTDTPDWPDVPETDSANPADINLDGMVNILDLSLIMENWLATPQP